MTSSAVDSRVAVVVALVLVVLGAVVLLAAARRSSRRLAADVVQVARGGSLVVRTVVVTGVIVAVQWVVIQRATDPRTVLGVLAVPAMVAGAWLARVFTVREITHRAHRRGGGHR